PSGAAAGEHEPALGRYANCTFRRRTSSLACPWGARDKQGCLSYDPPARSFARGDPLSEEQRAFSFLRVNQREGKPRSRGITEIRGPYYTPVGKRYLEDVLETMGGYVDILKFAGGSFTLMTRRVLRELLDVCHAHQVEV